MCKLLYFIGIIHLLKITILLDRYLPNAFNLVYIIDTLFQNGASQTGSITSEASGSTHNLVPPVSHSSSTTRNAILPSSLHGAYNRDRDIRDLVSALPFSSDIMSTSGESISGRIRQCRSSARSASACPREGSPLVGDSGPVTMGGLRGLSNLVALGDAFNYQSVQNNVLTPINSHIVVSNPSSDDENDL